MDDNMGDTARRGASGSWRKPRMKIYDYNQEFGGNYYQPMIHYINKKDIWGPYNKKQVVDLPDQAEVTSDKYTDMRHNDTSMSKVDLDNFLVKAYAKQIKELNSSTAAARGQMLRNSKDTTFYDGKELLGSHLEVDNARRHYTNELGKMNMIQRLEEEKRMREIRERLYRPVILQRIVSPEEEDEMRRDVRTKLYWIYRPRCIDEWEERVNHYASELHISKDHKARNDRLERKHCMDVQAFGNYQYHHELFEAPVNRNKRFFEPEKISSYVNNIR